MYRSAATPDSVPSVFTTVYHNLKITLVIICYNYIYTYAPLSNTFFEHQCCLPYIIQYTPLRLVMKRRRDA